MTLKRAPREEISFWLCYSATREGDQGIQRASPAQLTKIFCPNWSVERLELDQLSLLFLFSFFERCSTRLDLVRVPVFG